jgi:RsiW-degrading membrane proteinase PrsW (M82 family)
MLPSLFSLSQPASLFQVWFVFYLYALPLLLYGSWATLSLIDIAETADKRPRALVVVLILALPLLGGAWYLLRHPSRANRSARLASVIGGALVWLLPLLVGVWLVGRPLGPKALD